LKNGIWYDVQPSQSIFKLALADIQIRKKPLELV